jgi:hypothetical protein
MMLWRNEEEGGGGRWLAGKTVPARKKAKIQTPSRMRMLSLLYQNEHTTCSGKARKGVEYEERKKTKGCTE